MNKLVIYLDDQNKLKLKSQNPIDLEGLIQITQTAVLGFAKQVMSTVPKEDYDKVKGFIYDEMNVAFSRTLEVFAPEYDVSPDLTAQAIMEAEDAIIERKHKEFIASMKDK